MGERVSQQLDHRLVDFRRFAFGAQPDVLGRGIGHFANDARHALEQRAHRLGADGHDAFLDLARQPLQLLEARGHLAVAHVARMQYALGEHGLVDDQLAHEVDEAVDAVEIDADRRLHGGLHGLGRGVGFRRGCGGGRRGGDCRGFLAHLAEDCGDVHLRLRRRRRGGLRKLYGKVAVALDEIEDLLHRRALAVGFEAKFPGEIAVLRLEGVEEGKVLDIANRRERTEPCQFAEQRQRFIGLGEKLAQRAQADDEDVLCRWWRWLVEGGDDGLEREVREFVLLGGGTTATDERVEFLFDGHIGGGDFHPAVTARRHKVGQRIGGAQEQLHRIDIGHQFAGAHPVERRLEDMGEAHQRIELEGAGPALDRMHGAEHGIDGFGIAVAFLHRQKAILQGGELLLAFLEEGQTDFGHRVHAGTPLRRRRGGLRR